ncbi:hypothetical protein LguiA_019651 [Lonicera macranthoides]
MATSSRLKTTTTHFPSLFIHTIHSLLDLILFHLFLYKITISLSLSPFIDMALIASKFSYQRLKHDEGIFDEVGDRERVIIKNSVRTKRWSRLRNAHIKIKRVKVRFPWLLRRKARVFMVSWACKVLKRLKESQSHFGDLFGGNYVFLQVNPTPLKALQSSSSSSSSSSSRY